MMVGTFVLAQPPCSSSSGKRRQKLYASLDKQFCFVEKVYENSMVRRINEILNG
jgi:hypothetical protein